MVSFTSLLLEILALSSLTNARTLVTKAADISLRGATPNILSNLKPDGKWQICIHNPIKHDSKRDIIPSQAQVWDIDLSHAVDHPSMIPTLQKAGKTIICYLNVGALQSWDADYASFPRSVKGKTLGGPYTDEWYLDIRSSKVLSLMKARLDLAARIGCDAVDPDNIDAWVEASTTKDNKNSNSSGQKDRTGFKLTRKDYETYMIKLAAHAHSLPTKRGKGNRLLIGQKNAPELAKNLVKHMDFAVLESCREWGFCGDFQRYVQGGKPVFQIEYPSSVANGVAALSAGDRKRYCGSTTVKGKDRVDNDDRGFMKILKGASERLDGWGQYCSGSSFVTPTFEW